MSQYEYAFFSRKLHISPITSQSSTNSKTCFGFAFLLEMLSAVLHSERSYSAMPLAGQLIHQRFVILGPLVQENATLNFLPPEKDRIRTVSRRTKPNSRTAFIGEQPNPSNLLQLEDAMSRPVMLSFRLFILNFYSSQSSSDYVINTFFFESGSLQRILGIRKSSIKAAIFWLS